MTSVNGMSEHLANLLTFALGQVRAELLAASEAQHPGLRASHFRLLDLIPVDGARITDLAKVAGMTKQALGQHIDYLQDLGYTESVRLPADRRVRLVRRTARGEEAAAFARAAIARVEDAWSARLGAERYAAFRSTLEALRE